MWRILTGKVQFMMQTLKYSYSFDYLQKLNYVDNQRTKTILEQAILSTFAKYWNPSTGLEIIDFSNTLSEFLEMSISTDKHVGIGLEEFFEDLDWTNETPNKRHQQNNRQDLFLFFLVYYI